MESLCIKTNENYSTILTNSVRLYGATYVRIDARNACSAGDSHSFIEEYDNGAEDM
jgi:hypothetical protein